MPPCFPHGLQLISLFSTTILFSSYGKKPSDLTVGPNTAPAGVHAAIAICIAPLSLDKSKSTAERIAGSSFKDVLYAKSK